MTSTFCDDDGDGDFVEHQGQFQSHRFNHEEITIIGTSNEQLVNGYMMVNSWWNIIIKKNYVCWTWGALILRNIGLEVPFSVQTRPWYHTLLWIPTGKHPGLATMSSREKQHDHSHATTEGPVSLEVDPPIDHTCHRFSMDNGRHYPSGCCRVVTPWELLKKPFSMYRKSHSRPSYKWVSVKFPYLW